jgi:hypothetical protein
MCPILCSDSEKEHALPGNVSVNTFPRKRDARNNTVTMETGVFSAGSAPRKCSEDPRPAEGRVACVEANSNTSTVALRVVGGDEEGTQCLGV